MQQSNSEAEVIHRLKKLTVAIRQALPVDAINANVRLSFQTDPRNAYAIFINGAPPNDSVTLKHNEHIIAHYRNWGAAVVEELIKES